MLAGTMPAGADVRVFLFDIDGTLLTTKGVGNSALSMALREEFGVLLPDCDVMFSGRTDRSLIIELLQRNNLEPSDEHCNRLRDRYVSLMGGHLARQGGIVLPGIRRLLTELFRRDALELAVMTGNFPETATRKLEHFDLRQWFAWIAGGDAHVDRDDLARRTAAIVARRHGNRVKEMVVVGDTPADIRCGHAIGAKTIAVATGEFSIEALAAENPSQMFPNFSKTEEVLEALMRD
ncbi:HAD family hydrolase [Aporhodopirellula aestuarii]|uniref:phosphoglycolate phosphatase n=1 Tax=Aporhodopirellula aestuarii TaxID=2950107 RepID=A0ABT0UE16_9BACT|nr:HAD hydrolase-like protein [Aporhodopirellula aestuarii]MCM2375006.1 HAD hydrolase-like protein [Aporhodopirellula aestuarii]